MPSRASKTPASKPRSPNPEKAALSIQESMQESLPENMTGQLKSSQVLQLQRLIGNKAVGRLMKDRTVQRESHGKGCNCANCSSVQRTVDTRRVADIRRVDKQEADVQTTRIQRGFLDDVMVFFGVKTAEEVRQEGLAPLDKTKWNKTVADDSLMKDIAGKISVKDFIEASQAVKPLLKTLLDLAFKYWSSISLSDLEPVLNAATSDEKTAVCSDEKLLTKAEGALGKDPYLTFITRIGMNQPPTTTELGEGGKEHTAPAKADEIIRDKMSAYVTEAVKKGRKIEGQVGIVAGADWDRAGVAHYGDQVWHRATPTPKKNAINGFVDGSGRVWVERNSGNPGTVIHEGLHKYSDGAVLSTLGFNTNEGMTEYFTRLICADLGITRGNYTNNHDLITALVTTVTTKEVIASSYFDGKVDDLKAAFIKYRKDTKGNTEELAGQIWDAFVSNMKSGAWAKASKCINDDLDSDKLAAL